jgi:hypothetical protein
MGVTVVILGIFVFHCSDHRPLSCSAEGTVAYPQYVATAIG